MRSATFAAALAVAFTLAMEATQTRGATMASLQITSSAFANGGDIPSSFTCEGKDVSPQLAWSGVPAGTKSLALIVDDPDAPDPKAPKMTFVHWVLYDVPPSSSGLPENARARGLPDGAIEGVNGWGAPGYRGPCPPIGNHRYFFKLYALDTTLENLKSAGKPELERAMEGHVLAKGEMIGRYEKKAK